MKKRLGAVPKGLEWISEDQQLENFAISEKRIPEHLQPAAKRGLQKDLIRATFILRQEYLEKIKAHAYWERLQIKEVFDLMCKEYFRNKKIKSLPENRR